jgi:hypothetical protein
VIRLLANAGWRIDRSEAEEVVGEEVVRLAAAVKAGSPIPTSASINDLRKKRGRFFSRMQVMKPATHFWCT